MDREKYIKGVLSAPPEKRYKTFLSTVTDSESVWVLVDSASGDDGGFASFYDEEYIYLLVWPTEEFASLAALETDTPYEIKVHKFIEMCAHMGTDEKIMVFPTDRDSYVVSKETIIEDLEEYLSELE